MSGTGFTCTRQASIRRRLRRRRRRWRHHHCSNDLDLDTELKFATCWSCIRAYYLKTSCWHVGHSSTSSLPGTNFMNKEYCWIFHGSVRSCSCNVCPSFLRAKYVFAVKLFKYSHCKTTTVSFLICFLNVLTCNWVTAQAQCWVGIVSEWQM